MVERQLESEYLLKSLVNLSASLISLDSSPNIDAVQDPWGYFVDGKEIPPDLLKALGYNPTGMQVYLQIRPENMKFPIDKLNDHVKNSSKSEFEFYRDALQSLLENLGIDTDYQEEDHTGLFKGQVFDSYQLTANLIDYMDQDEDPYSDGNFSGIESSSISENFRNDKITRVEELTQIPGFTPRRVARLMPFVTTQADGRVNLNVAKVPVIQALHSDIDEAMAESIYSFVRDTQPAESMAQLKDNIPGFSNTIYNSLNTYAHFKSTRFEVIGKVEYPNSVTFVRAMLYKGPSGLPDIPKISDLHIY